MPLKLTKRPDRPGWIIRGTVAGKRVHKSAVSHRKREAAEEARRLEERLVARASLGTGATLTFAEAALTYLESGGEGRFLPPILRHLGAEFLLSDLTNEALTEAARAIYPTASPNTVQRQLITPAQAVYNLAVDDGLAAPRKFRRRGRQNRRTDWLTPEEAERVIEIARDRFPHILRPIALMLGGGCRSSEALQVSAAAFYTTTGEAWLANTKNGHPRMIRLPRRALDLALEERLPEIGPICLTPKGKPYVIRKNGGGQMKGAFDTIQEAAEISLRLTPHVLRHTWATWYHAQTKDFGALLDLGGWERADVANIYRKIAPEDLGDQLHGLGWDFTRSDFRDAQKAKARGKVASLAARRS